MTGAPRPPRAVSFDFGQTLAELDTGLLAARVRERGVAADEAALEAAVPLAWRAYNDAVRAGTSGHPWKLLMATLLGEGGVAPAAIDALTDFLWDEQPKKNLWRRPIPGMIELVRELARSGVPVAVLSNSEGKLWELVVELGWERDFLAVADSGKLGIEKPDRPIFEWTRERLGVAMDEVVHVGDSVAADVAGALRAGMRAVWFKGDPALVHEKLGPVDAERLAFADDAASLRAALVAWGLPLPGGASSAQGTH